MCSESRKVLPPDAHATHSGRASTAPDSVRCIPGDRPSWPLVNGRDHWLVRPAREQDFDQLFGMVSAVAEEDKWIGAQAPLDRLTTISRWTADLVDPNAALVVSEDHGEIVGEASVHLDAGRADLGMQVTEPYRGLGVGTALMEAVLTWAMTQGAHKITLQVWPHNHAARRLYQRFGFVTEG